MAFKVGDRVIVKAIDRERFYLPNIKVGDKGVIKAVSGAKAAYEVSFLRDNEFLFEEELELIYTPLSKRENTGEN